MPARPTYTVPTCYHVIAFSHSQSAMANESCLGSLLGLEKGAYEREISSHNACESIALDSSKRRSAEKGQPLARGGPLVDAPGSPARATHRAGSQINLEGQQCRRR